MRADAPAEFRDFDVFGMNGVGIERCSIFEDADETSVVRAREEKSVSADRQTLNLGNEVF